MAWNLRLFFFGIVLQSVRFFIGLECEWCEREKKKCCVSVTSGTRTRTNSNKRPGKMSEYFINILSSSSSGRLLFFSLSRSLFILYLCYHFVNYFLAVVWGCSFFNGWLRWIQLCIFCNPFTKLLPLKCWMCPVLSMKHSKHQSELMVRCSELSVVQCTHYNLAFCRFVTFFGSFFFSRSRDFRGFQFGYFIVTYIFTTKKKWELNLTSLQSIIISKYFDHYFIFHGFLMWIRK